MAGTITAAEVSNECIATESLKNNAGLFIGGELVSGNAFNVLDGLLSLFGPGLGLPEPV